MVPEKPRGNTEESEKQRGRERREPYRNGNEAEGQGNEKESHESPSRKPVDKWTGNQAGQHLSRGKGDKTSCKTQVTVHPFVAMRFP